MRSIGLIFALTLPSAALAQLDAPLLSPPTIIAAPPATDGGPNVMPPPATPGKVPSLPPSRTCVQQDMQGLWKLLHVYEEPMGPETSVFYSVPSQYMNFKGDSTFEAYEHAKDVPISIAQILAIMKERTKGLQQYVVQANGQLYYYRDSVANKQQACFVVVEGNQYFAAGQMLLMPPNPQSPTRWVKVYSKIFIQSAQSGKKKKRRGQDSVQDITQQPVPFAKPVFGSATNPAQPFGGQMLAPDAMIIPPPVQPEELDDEDY